MLYQLQATDHPQMVQVSLVRCINQINQKRKHIYRLPQQLVAVFVHKPHGCPMWGNVSTTTNCTLFSQHAA
jgi:hypothetical protein